jgi:hypothetical protein
MKTFQLQELMDWLEANPDREFNYYQPSTSCGCMLAQFFYEKGVSTELSCKIKSPWQCTDITPDWRNQFPIAIIEGTENLSIVKIHYEGIENPTKVKGSVLLERIKAELQNVPLVSPS